MNKTVTCFTSCAIKAWCTTAVESVHSVCTGPVVLTGMTCAVINICFRRLDEKDKIAVYISELETEKNHNNFLFTLLTHSHVNHVSKGNFSCLGQFCPGGRFSKAPETFQASAAIAKSRTLRVESFFNHIF